LFREFVHVQHDGFTATFGGIRSFLSTDDWVGFSFHRADVILKTITPLKFNVHIGLLDRFDDFVVQICLFFFQVFRVRFRVFVLCFQVRENFFVLSIVVAQPEKVVVDLNRWIHGILASILAGNDTE